MYETVENFTAIEETTAWALRHPLKFIELGVSLGGDTREKALALLKEGIDYVEAKIGKPMHELALERLDGRCKPDGNHFRALPYGFAELRKGLWLPFTRAYKPLGLWPLGCWLSGCNRSGCPIREYGYWTGKPRRPCITKEQRDFVRYESFEHQALRFATDPRELDVWSEVRGSQIWLYNNGIPSRKGYFGRLGRVLSAATPESRAVVLKQCWPNLPRLRVKRAL